ncbi:MAG: glucodextranase DOMON-like domain-containing protein [Bacteroidota bacterium]
MRRSFWVVAAFLLILCRVGFAENEPDFRLLDPAGDDYGPGSYIYPKNHAFEPYHGLFDLRSFTVSSDVKSVRFDLTLADLRNPWSAPEGFSHQLLEVFIARGNGFGRTEPFAAGSFVRFAPEHPWDVMLKAAPWDSSELILLGPDGQPVKHGLQVGLAGPQTVRATVPVALLGAPERTWRYYVLVGSYDGFGEDNFRPVMAKAGEWHFGGGRNDAAEPQVIDILAPERGRFSQEKQLGSYDWTQKKLAVLQPVGPGYLPGMGGFPWAIVAVLGCMLVIVAWWNWYAPAGWREKILDTLAGLVRRQRGIGAESSK